MEISFNEIAENWRNRGDIDDVGMIGDSESSRDVGNHGIGTVSAIKARKYRPCPSFCFSSSTYG